MTELKKTEQAISDLGIALQKLEKSLEKGQSNLKDKYASKAELADKEEKLEAMKVFESKYLSLKEKACNVSQRLDEIVAKLNESIKENGDA